MHVTAVCVRCGSPKRSWALKCTSCGLDPNEDVEVAARSYVLSTERYDAGSGPEDQMGLPDFEERDLQEIGRRIHDGIPYEFRPEHLRRVVSVLETMKASPPSRRSVAGYLLRFFLPAIIFFGLLLGLILLLRVLR